MLFDGECLVPSPSSTTVFMFPIFMGDFGEVVADMVVQRLGLRSVARAFVVDL